MKAPNATSHPDEYKEWQIKDQEACAQITLTLKDEPLSGVMYETSAAATWKKLGDRYEGKGKQSIAYIIGDLFRGTLADDQPMETQLNAMHQKAHILASLGQPLNNSLIAIAMVISLPQSYSTLRTILGNVTGKGYPHGSRVREYDGRISFTTDAWTAPNHKAYVAFCVHLEQEGVPLSFPLDIVEVVKSHTGHELAQAFADVLHEFGLATKILSITCDNASNNDAMIDELARNVPTFGGKASHTRCFLHIVNLMAKSLIRQFDIKKDMDAIWDGSGERRELEDLAGEEMEEAPDLDVTNDEQSATGIDNDEGWVDEIELLTPEELEELEEAILPVKLALAK
ncbi:hypothetical protein PISMIDRAFT_14278, partial [Pisolithus microcarpus 441]